MKLSFGSMLQARPPPETFPSVASSSSLASTSAWVVGKICASLESEVVNCSVRDLVVEVIREATDKFLASKRAEQRVNPLVSIILDIIETGSVDLIRPVVFEVPNDHDCRIAIFTFLRRRASET
jgi:hypothetical protein